MLSTQRFSFFITPICIALFTVACAPSVTPQEKAALEKDANRAVTCKAGIDCADKWKLTEQWIKMNSSYKIIAKSDLLIETSIPSELDDGLGFSATKRRYGDDTSIIMLDITCNDWFGCSHKRLDARARFVNFIMGPPPPPIAFGVKTSPVGANLADKLGMSGVAGLFVTAVAHGSPADKIGLQAEDIILEYDGVTVTDETMFQEMMSKTPPGKHINLVIIRNKTKRTLTINT